MAKPVYFRKPRRKFCRFCKDKVDHIDYKDLSTLRAFISDKGKIKPRRSTGTCARHQKKLAQAIKNAREVALIPYTSKQ